MKSPVFLWNCPSCGEYVRTELPAREEEAVLVCPACGSAFGEKAAAPEPERKSTTA